MLKKVISYLCHINKIITMQIRKYSLLREESASLNKKKTILFHFFKEKWQIKFF